MMIAIDISHYVSKIVQVKLGLVTQSQLVFVRHRDLKDECDVTGMMVNVESFPAMAI